MSRGRYLPGRDYLAIKAGQRDLIDAAGGVRRAARVTGYPHQALSRCLSEDEEHEDRFLRADLVADLEADCGRPVLTAVLAELSGHVLVRLPDANVPGTPDLVGRISEVLGEVADVSARAAEAIRDGRITAREAEQLHIEIVEAQQALVRLDLSSQTTVRAEAGGRK